MELELVEELRAVAADDPEELRRSLGRELVRAREVEPPLEPDGVDRQVLEQHRPALGDGVVAEPPLLRRQGRRPCGRSARCGRPRGRATASRLARPAASCTRTTRPGTSIGEQNARGSLFGRSSRSSSTFCCARRSMPRSASVPSSAGSIRSRRERRVPLDAAPGAAHVPALDLAEPEADARAEEPVAGLLPEVLGVGEQAPALLGEVVEREAEAAVEVGVARRRRAGGSRAGRPAQPAAGARSGALR